MKRYIFISVCIVLFFAMSLYAPVGVSDSFVPYGDFDLIQAKRVSGGGANGTLGQDTLGLTWVSGSPLIKMTATDTFGLDTTQYYYPGGPDVNTTDMHIGDVINGDDGNVPTCDNVYDYIAGTPNIGNATGTSLNLSGTLEANDVNIASLDYTLITDIQWDETKLQYKYRIMTNGTVGSESAWTDAPTN